MVTGTPSLKIGPYEVDSPVVLAPMAGIANVAFRRLCRQYGAGLYVCEMITTRALVERDAMTIHPAHLHSGRGGVLIAVQSVSGIGYN